MGVIESGQSGLTCQVCQSEYPLTAAFCTNCGTNRENALGGAAVNSAQTSLNIAQPRLSQEDEWKLRQEQERIRTEERLAALEQKRQARQEFRERNRKNFRVGAGLLIVFGVYCLAQVAIWTRVSPEALASRYFAAIHSTDSRLLSDTTLFPNPDPEYKVAPSYLLQSIQRNKTSNYQVDTKWTWISGKAGACDSDDNCVSFTSADKWNLIFRVRNWQVSEAAPRVAISVKSGITPKIRTAKIGSHRISMSTVKSLTRKPLKYVVWPGTLDLSTAGKGFVEDWNSSTDIAGGAPDRLVMNVGKVNLSQAELDKASNSASAGFYRCLTGSGRCGTYLSMSDFGIDYPYYYEDYSVSDSATSNGCSQDSVSFRDSSTAVVTFSCSGSVSRSVTWLIASYYFLPNDYDYDFGSADVTTTMTVRLKYSDTKRRSYVDWVSYGD